MTFEKSADKIMLLRVSDVAHGVLVKNATVATGVSNDFADEGIGEIIGKCYH